MVSLILLISFVFLTTGCQKTIIGKITATGTMELIEVSFSKRYSKGDVSVIVVGVENASEKNIRLHYFYFDTLYNNDVFKVGQIIEITSESSSLRRVLPATSDNRYEEVEIRKAVKFKIK